MPVSAKYTMNVWCFLPNERKEAKLENIGYAGVSEGVVCLYRRRVRVSKIWKA